MRMASSSIVAALLLVDCGAKQDLIIGELALSSDAGSAGVSSGSGGADATGGAVTTAGSGGSSDPTAGSNDTGGADTAGAAGMAGSSDEDCIAGDEPPLGSLLHRYSFDGSGATATDSVSAADGNIVGTTLDGSGLVTMDGNTRQYVDLPDGIVSELTDLTVVTWMTWTGGGAYQRVFDFGISTQGEGLGDSGRSFLAVMPMTGFDDQRKPGLGGEVKAPGFPTVTLASTEEMEDRAAQVGFVFRSGVSASLYLDGNRLASAATAITLADIDDRNNWLGQSQFQTDPEFEGAYEEFRIYDAALNSCQLHTLLVRGPQSP
jgi:hypothetical protein